LDIPRRNLDPPEGCAIPADDGERVRRAIEHALRIFKGGARIVEIAP
jgi:hypothetical protein